MDREKERARRLRLKMLPMARVGNVSSSNLRRSSRVPDLQFFPLFYSLLIN